MRRRGIAALVLVSLVGLAFFLLGGSGGSPVQPGLAATALAPLPTAPTLPPSPSTSAMVTSVPAAVGLTPVPPANPGSARLEVLAVSGHVANGQVVVEGKIKNVSAESLWDVWGVADWYDSAGAVSKSYLSPLNQDRLRVDQVSTFKVAATARPGIPYFMVRFADGRGNAIVSRDAP